MSYSQGTTHYNFPQITGADRPTFADNNQAFRILDEKLFALEADSIDLDTRLDAAEENIGNLQEAVNAAQETANSANGKADTNAEQIGLINNELSQHNTRITGKLDSVAIADPYLPTSTYSVGDVVTYNGQRYKCVTAITTGEPFDVSKWQGEDVESVLSSLNNKLNLTNKWSTSVDSIAVLAGTQIAEDAIIYYKAIYLEWSLYSTGPWKPLLILAPNETGTYADELSYYDSSGSRDRRITIEFKFSGRYVSELSYRSQYGYNEVPETGSDITNHIYVRKVMLAV